MPTLAELAGAACPTDIDGISILPTLLGRRAAGRAQKKHKYLYWEFVGQTAVRWGDWKAYKSRKGDWELYDLSKDIEEQHNVAAKNQDTLAMMIKFAEESHTPHIPGKIVNKQICMKDHTKAKNPKPSERRRWIPKP
jgi:arylsulfatase A-like enzyme